MISKNELKYIQSLSHKKNRDVEGLFIAEGPKIVEELIRSNIRIKKIFAVKEWKEFQLPHTEIIEVSAAELERISNLQTPHEVFAIAEMKHAIPIPSFTNKLTLILDGIQDPGNMGTLIRIADWFGIDQVIASNDSVELYNPKVIQSTMGSFIRVAVWHTDLQELLQAPGVPVYGALLNGKNMYEAGQPKEGFIVIGNESKGIREKLLPLITNPVTIPKKGGAESLNAAVAAGIILSQLTK